VRNGWYDPSRSTCLSAYAILETEVKQMKDSISAHPGLEKAADYEATVEECKDSEKAVREQVAAEERDRFVAELLRKYPPILQLEEMMGPEPTPAEAGEVDAFLRARSQWQQPYAASEEAG
jgi:hypothetical protein